MGLGDDEAAFIHTLRARLRDDGAPATLKVKAYWAVGKTGLDWRLALGKADGKSSGKGHVTRGPGCVVLGWKTGTSALHDTQEPTMKPRMNAFAVAPDAMKLTLEYGQKLLELGLEKSLQELVKIRASQLNGCAFCIHMHALDARAHGETEERIYLLDGWRESPLYTERERAALAWTETLTQVSQTHAPDADYAALKPHFTEQEIVHLTLLIGMINTWNRISVGFRSIHPVTAPRTEAA